MRKLSRPKLIQSQYQTTSAPAKTNIGAGPLGDNINNQISI